MPNITQINPMGWVRLIIYILSALVGIAAVAVNAVGMGELSALLGTIAGAGAAITGGTAAFNLPKAPDQNRAAGIDVLSVLPALNDIAQAARTYQGTMDYQPRHDMGTADAYAVETDYTQAKE